jgi:uncharacterized protein YndB with AHSA1/START domain
MPTGTVKFHRILKTTPEKLYRAFLEADALVKWLPPYGFTCKIEYMDAKVGGTFKMSFVNFGTKIGESFGGTYLELVPFKKIVYSDIFDNSNLAGEMQTTIMLREVLFGTELEIEQRGIPEAIPLEMCYLGWQESLEQLAKLTEVEILGE